jgi:hypothetical protein
MIAAIFLGFRDGFAGFFLIFVSCLYAYQKAGEWFGNSSRATKVLLALGTFFLTMAALGALTMYWLDYLTLVDHESGARRILGKYWVGGTVIGMTCLAVLRGLRRR